MNVIGPGDRDPVPARPAAAEDPGTALVQADNGTALELSPPPEPVLADWKARIRDDVEKWLAALEDCPERLPVDGERVDAPDLFSFHGLLASMGAEFRKTNRRTAEAISQWAETLSRFDTQWASFRETLAGSMADSEPDDALSAEHGLMLVEILDRMQRIGRAFATVPVRETWWRGGDGAWRQAWKAQGEALSILVGHLEGLLRKEGITRLATLGQPFDPTRMLAVAAEGAGGSQPLIVTEEMASGYLRHGRLLRAAQVKVGRP